MKKTNNLNKEILSIEYDDDNENYDEFNKFLNHHTNRIKSKTAEDIEIMGEQFLSEIDKKKNLEKNKIKKLIPYILKNSDNYSENELISYSLKDVTDIYNEIKQRKNIFRKIFFFFFS